MIEDAGSNFVSDISAPVRSHSPPINSKEELSYCGIMAIDDATGQSFMDTVTVTVSPAFTPEADEIDTTAGSAASIGNAPSRIKDTLSNTIEMIFFNLSSSSTPLLSEADKNRASMCI